MTRERYLISRRSNNLDIEDLWNYYNETEHSQPKVDYNTFQQMMPHYVQRGGSMDLYFRTFDQKFEVLHIKSENGFSLIV